uniref:Uncharacterized protein n=1 Tax=Chromera velia CCMP2878 TaxID=1169474 RepID=A0A0G4IAK4_9ALVE|eukprot:Cvel_2124.t1-p1 / transcript=Cvel_2124.t1 / gene=Cvel_2124 / organism=Chromera_velia_CCMP2878 / gene_product=hypothetical protein / transcript_product=hypothetical protein / location=Cvel_scaffold82:47963-49962(-) / protein_length=230 / sequence_SO=supercontig / SO=protein_coding / is_pseudo=false
MSAQPAATPSPNAVTVQTPSSGPEKFPHTEYEKKSIPYFWGAIGFSLFYIVFGFIALIVGHWIAVIYNLLFSIVSLINTAMALSGCYLCFSNNDFWWAVAYGHLLGAVYWLGSLPLHVMLSYYDGLIEHELKVVFGWATFAVSVLGLALYSVFAYRAYRIADGMGRRRLARMRAFEEAQRMRDAVETVERNGGLVVMNESPAPTVATEPSAPPQALEKDVPAQPSPYEQV